MMRQLSKKQLKRRLYNINKKLAQYGTIMTSIEYFTIELDYSMDKFREEIMKLTPHLEGLKNLNTSHNNLQHYVNKFELNTISQLEINLFMHLISNINLKFTLDELYFIGVFFYNYDTYYKLKLGLKNLVKFKGLIYERFKNIDKTLIFILMEFNNYKNNSLVIDISKYKKVKINYSSHYNRERKLQRRIHEDMVAVPILHVHDNKKYLEVNKTYAYTVEFDDVKFFNNLIFYAPITIIFRVVKMTALGIEIELITVMNNLIFRNIKIKDVSGIFRYTVDMKVEYLSIKNNEKYELDNGSLKLLKE
jgi:hypothetical protein